MIEKGILNTWELSNNDLKRVLNGVVKENALGDMNWTNRSLAFQTTKGEPPITNELQHKRLRIEREREKQYWLKVSEDET